MKTVYGLSSIKLKKKKQQKTDFIYTRCTQNSAYALHYVIEPRKNNLKNLCT